MTDFTIPTYYQNWLRRQGSQPVESQHPSFLRHAAWRKEGRMVPWERRRSIELDGLDAHRRSEIPNQVLVMSQGTSDVMKWRGRNLYKCVFDFALIPMLLAELRPSTILEIGSGTGASAAWLLDLATINGITTSIYSVDVQPVTVEIEGIQFIQGDARELANVLPNAWSKTGPRLVLEDAHVGVDRVLDYLDDHLRPGDYIFVEDSVGKSETLTAFLTRDPGKYAVDTFYTDFFGRNATSCVDSILMRMR